MKSYTQFSENADRAAQLRQQQQKGVDSYKASLQKGMDAVKRREENAKRAKLRGKLNAVGVDDEDGLLDDDDDD